MGWIDSWGAEIGISRSLLTRALWVRADGVRVTRGKGFKTRTRRNNKTSDEPALTHPSTFLPPLPPHPTNHFTLPSIRQQRPIEVIPKRPIILLRPLHTHHHLQPPRQSLNLFPLPRSHHNLPLFIYARIPAGNPRSPRLFRRTNRVAYTRIQIISVSVAGIFYCLLQSSLKGTGSEFFIVFVVGGSLAGFFGSRF